MMRFESYSVVTGINNREVRISYAGGVLLVALAATVEEANGVLAAAQGGHLALLDSALAGLGRQGAPIETGRKSYSEPASQEIPGSPSAAWPKSELAADGARTGRVQSREPNFSNPPQSEVQPEVGAAAKGNHDGLQTLKDAAAPVMGAPASAARRAAKSLESLPAPKAPARDAVTGEPPKEEPKTPTEAKTPIADAATSSSAPDEQGGGDPWELVGLPKREIPANLASSTGTMRQFINWQREANGPQSAEQITKIAEAYQKLEIDGKPPMPWLARAQEIPQRVKNAYATLMLDAATGEEMPRQDA